MPEENNISRGAIERLGVDPDNLGCVMLDVDIPEMYRNALDPSKAYYSERLDYVKGYEGQMHITLLYGLMNSAATPKGRAEVDALLDTWWKPGVMTGSTISVFPGNDGGNDYGCLVMLPDPMYLHDNPNASTDKEYYGLDLLTEGNARLSKLPHVRRFYTYKPHITIGYVTKDYIDEALSILRGLGPAVVRVGGLDYGD